MAESTPDPKTARDPFPRVLAAEGVSNFGAMLSRLAIPWLATLVLLATPAQMALLLVADVVSAALAALLLGGWVDRRGKRALMLACDAGRALLLGLLALGAWRGWLGMGTLLAAAAASGVLTVGFEMARSAWTAQCVAAADLPRRNAQLSMVGSVSETVAFAAGGWLYQWLGAALALLLNACSYGVSALCLRGVPEAAQAPAALAVPVAGNATRNATLSATLRRHWQALRDEAMAGLRTVAAVPALRALAGIEGLLAFGMALTGTSLMIYVIRDLGLGTGELGLVFALGGLGAVTGGSLAPRLGRRLGPGRTMALGLALMAVGAACVPLAGVLGGAGLAALAWLAAQQIVGDAGHTVHDVHDRTLRQTAVPMALLARADGGIRSIGQGATLAGALTGGVLGNFAGTLAVLWLAVAMAVAASLLAAWAAPRLVPDLTRPA